MSQFLSSSTYNRFVAFLESLSEKVKGLKCTDTKDKGLDDSSELLVKLTGLFARLDEALDDIPPRKQAQRYGNKAFRDWFDWNKGHAVEFMEAILPESHRDAAVELAGYWCVRFMVMSCCDLVHFTLSSLPLCVRRLRGIVALFPSGCG